MFALMYDHKFEIDTSGSKSGSDSSTFKKLAAGINNVEPSNEEETDQSVYLDGGGFTETDVISAQLMLTFTGHRDYNDEAQNFIFGKLLTLGDSRRVNFRWTEPDGGKFEGECTIASISGPSGDAGAKGEISFEIHFAGKPEYTPTP